MPLGPYIKEKFTLGLVLRSAACARILLRYPKERYETEVESWRHLQSRNYAFTVKRLRVPVGPL